MSCTVHAHPPAIVIWKIDYDNKELNLQPEEPDEGDDYWVPPDLRVVIGKTKGRCTLQPYNGVNNAELIIANVTYNDSGNYSCCATNIAGEQCKNLLVKVTRAAAEEGLNNGKGTSVKTPPILLIVLITLIGVFLLGICVILCKRRNILYVQVKNQMKPVSLEEQGNSATYSRKNEAVKLNIGSKSADEE